MEKARLKALEIAVMQLIQDIRFIKSCMVEVDELMPRSRYIWEKPITTQEIKEFRIQLNKKGLEGIDDY